MKDEGGRMKKAAETSGEAGAGGSEFSSSFLLPPSSFIL
jgi:hypothetical protein